MLRLVKTKKTSQRHIRAWETWGKFRIPEQEHLWRSYTTRVTVSEMTDVINSHWPLIICVLTNPRFVETISNQQENGKDLAASEGGWTRPLHHGFNSGFYYIAPL
ncbi:hypothetical protein FOZG_08194 [Fusarium oxysporum Fo47]|uniref:Uncharacterized protein n=1 Tax=Fusarium oxysporum Fo47 TaxID=660027 RepID=W9KAG6_FUSOX|nr:hypothetical protein FOZG_08194 [Fusarium oxysporum Fo47]